MPSHKRIHAISFILIIALLLNLISITTPFITPTTATQPQETLVFTTSFSSLQIKQNTEFATVTLEGTTATIVQEGGPHLPKVTKTIELPWGSTITDVSYSYSTPQTQQLSLHVQPVPSYSIIGSTVTKDISYLEPEVYLSEQPFPIDWFQYHKGVGLNKDSERVLFVTFHMHPVRYIPLSRTLESIEELTISLTYQQIQEPLQPQSSSVDLLIITPEEYIPALNRLAAHKQALGVTTEITDLQSIYNAYMGRDKPEQIKQFIYHSILTSAVTHVLLVGDIKKLPIRSTDAYPWGGGFGGDILTDLYYADIFNHTYEFCDWDANQNNIFGEVDYSKGLLQGIINVDEVDLYPDIYLGRLPCSTIEEVHLLVDKIIIYENKTYDQTWFQHIILAGGNTFCLGQGSKPFVYEGEITNVKVAQQLPGFEKTYLWASKYNLNPLTFNQAMTQGAGFFSYAGHGFEHGWATYRPFRVRPKLSLTQHVYYQPMIQGIHNQHKLPIMFFDACLTAKLDFNVTDLQRYYPLLTPFLVALNILPGDPTEYLPCFAYSFLNKKDGGAIATVGATRPAYTFVDADGVYAGAGYLDVHFFKAYEEGITLGEMMHHAQLDYINNVGKDFFTLETFILLGDPSMHVGGHPLGNPFNLP